MRARPAGLIALLALALSTSSACGGGEDRVLATREYADAVIAARQESDEEIEGLAAEFATEIEAIQARFEEGIGDIEVDTLEGDAFATMRPLTEDFAADMLDGFGAFIGSAAQVVQDHVAFLEGLGAPPHLKKQHEALVLALEAYQGALETFASDLAIFDRTFPTLRDFEAFGETFAHLVDGWGVEALDGDADAACKELKAVLERDLGSLDMCN